MVLDCLRGEILHFVQDDIQTPVVLSKAKDLVFDSGVTHARDPSAIGTGLGMTTRCRPERALVFCRPEQGDLEASPEGEDLGLALVCRPERAKRGGTCF